MVLEDYFCAGVSQFSLHEFNVFLVGGWFLVWMLATSFSVYADHYALYWRCDGCCSDQSLHCMLSRTSSLLCGCQSSVRSRICSPVVGADAPRSVYELQCGVGVTGALPLGEESLITLLQELSTRKYTLRCQLLPNVHAHKVHCCYIAAGTAFSCENVGTGCPSGSVLTKSSTEIHWHRSTYVRHWDPP